MHFDIIRRWKEITESDTTVRVMGLLLMQRGITEGMHKKRQFAQSRIY